MKTYSWDSLRCVNYFKIVFSLGWKRRSVSPDYWRESANNSHENKPSPRNFELHYFNKANIYAVCRCVDFVETSYRG